MLVKTAIGKKVAERALGDEDQDKMNREQEVI